MDIFTCHWWRYACTTNFGQRTAAGFQAAAQVLEHLDKQGQHPPSPLAWRNQSIELNREGSDTDKSSSSCSISKLPMTSARIPDKYQQVAYRQESRQQALLHNSFWVQCSSVRQMLILLPVRRDEHDSNVSVGSQRPQEGRMPSTGGPAVKRTTTSWSTGGGVEGNDQGPSLLERGKARKATPGIRKGDQESQDVPGSSTGGSRILEDQQSHWKLKRFSSWLNLQSVFQKKESSSQKYMRRKNSTSAAVHPNRKEPAQQQSWRKKTSH